MRTLLVITIMLVSATALAQDTGETTREMVGFTAGGKVVVRAVGQGERIVDGSAKSYYYELDEVWDPRLPSPLSRHRRGEATGFEHPEWKAAKTEPVTVVEWVEGATSPSGGHLVVTVVRNERRAGDQGWVCTATARTVLMSKEAQAAFLVDEKSAEGEPGTRSSQAICPAIVARPGWSQDGKRFVVERRLGDSFGLVGGSVNATGNYDEKPLRPAGSLDPLGNLPVGPLRSAWEAHLLGHADAAARALEADGLEATGWSQLAEAWVDGRRGDERKAGKAARRAAKKVKGDPIGLAMLGGAYALAGDNRRVKRTLNSALKTAEEWKTFVRMALLLRDVDLSLFNQVLVYGLSSEDGKANAESWAWRLLIDGLVDAGLPEKGEGLLERIPEDDPARAGAEARLAVGAGEGERARPLATTLLWADVGNCDAYLLGGRAELLTGAPAAALPLLNAASFCDPRAGEAWYFLAELHRAAGRPALALRAARAFLDASPDRRNDAVRDLRRDRAKKIVERLDGQRVGLLSLTCRPLGPTFLCQGVVSNRTEAAVEGLAAVISKKSTELGRSELPTIPPGETRSFGVRVETLDDAALTVGRDDDEKKRNRVNDLRQGW